MAGVLNSCDCTSFSLYNFFRCIIYFIKKFLNEDSQVKPTCNESECGLRLRPHYFDLAEDGERHTVVGFGESLDFSTRAWFGVTVLRAGKGEHVKMRRAELSVKLLQSPVILLR